MPKHYMSSEVIVSNPRYWIKLDGLLKNQKISMLSISPLTIQIGYKDAFLNMLIFYEFIEFDLIK